MDIANEIALIVCRQCTKNESETEIEFSTRLYGIYNECVKNIQGIIEPEPAENFNDNLKMVNQMKW